MIIFPTKILGPISIKALTRIAELITTVYKISILLIRKLTIYIVSANLPFRQEISFLSIYEKTVNLPGLPVKDIPRNRIPVFSSSIIYLPKLLFSLP